MSKLIYLLTACEEATRDLLKEDGDVLPEAERQFVIDVLSLHRALYLSYEALEDKSDVSDGHIKFRGFDGNNEILHLSFCRRLCEHHGVFAELADHGHDHYNSHLPVLDVYHRMLLEWDSMGRPDGLTKEQIIELQMAQIHPQDKPGEDEAVQ